MIVFNYYSNEVQGDVSFVVDKQVVLRGNPMNPARVGMFVVVNEHDGAILGFVSQEMVRTYLSWRMGRAITRVEFARVCDVCHMALALVTAAGHPVETAVEKAAAIGNGNEFMEMAKFVFRGTLFQYHLFDSVNPDDPLTHHGVTRA